MSNIIGDNIKKHRALKNMTQKELADYLGVTESAVCIWERGKGLPRMGSVDKMTKLFDISKSEFIDGIEPTSIAILEWVMEGFTEEEIADVISYAKYIKAKKANAF